MVTAVPGTSQSAPLAGATVTLLSSNLHATTDERGQFLIGPLPRGDYRLFFSSKGSGITRQRLLTGVPVRPGATNTVGDVSIQENALLTGRALIQGRSQGNVGITIFSPGTDYVTTSADNGGWLLSNLPEGTIRASAWRPGFTPATTTDIELQGGVITSAVDMILEPENASAPPGSILGRVIVIGHDDSSGVTVKAISSQTQEVKISTFTDGAGNFTLAGLTPDLYTITLELSGYPNARVPNLAVSGGVQLELVDPIIMAVEGDGNVRSDEPIGGPSGPLYTLDGGVTSPDGGVITTEDGGTIGAECTDDNQCASGRLCVSNRCVSCSVNVQCRPGFSCVAGDCVRDCTDNAQCSGGKVCIGGSCTSCITSSDCRDPSLVCNPQSLCAHCRDRSECPTGKACLPGGCGDCTQDSECGAGAICEQGVCTPGDCHGNADCASNEACVGRSCDACTADAQCRPGQLCVSGECRPGNCRSELECTAGQVCSANLCGACSDDLQCGAGKLCLAGRCTTGNCRFSGDCSGTSAGLLCVNNACTGCSSANPCTNGQICNGSGRCVTGNCFSNLDCTNNQACIAGNCTPCSTNAQCAASGFVCVGGECRVGNCVSPADCALQGQLCTNNACVGCTASNQCGSNQVCDPNDGLCHPGNCLTTADCGANQVCNNRVCGACTNDTQCGFGKLCLGGQCSPGDCRVPSDCGVAGQICVGNQCSACTATSQCASGQVCDTDGLCHPGNCVSNADCNGRICTARSCTNCTSDSQCTAGKICISGPGTCVTGVCHSSADCSGGLQLCDTAPNSPTAWTCQPCAPLNSTTGNTCGTGRVCDGAGQCHFGTCISNAQCGGATPVCVDFNCTTCTQDSQCNSGQLCVNNQCRTGNCHGTGPDPNVDCAATNNLCVNNVCSGNCRTNADCTATGYCNVTGPVPTCQSCTGGGQCGPGKVCSTGGSGNTCITAQCSNLEPNCAIGESCVSGACVQLGPNNTPDGGGYLEPGIFNTSGQISPMALSGANTIYLSMAESSSSTGAGNYSVALEPNLALRWRVRDSTGPSSKNSFGGAGIVLPAPGYPNGELFLATDGNNGSIAHRSDNGTQAWRIPFQPPVFATGIVNQVPHVAWYVSGNPSTAYWIRTDGTQQRSLTLNGCSTPLALAFGTFAIYVVCGDALYVVDPITGIFKTVPHAGNPSLNIGGNTPAAVTPIWRPPNNYVARGVDSGTVTSDVLVYMGRSGVDWLLAVRVPDDWVTNSSPTNTWTVWSNSTARFGNTPLTIDATGAIHILGSELYKINVHTGAQITKLTTPGGVSLWSNLGASSQLVSVVGNNPQTNTLQGFLLGDGQTTAPAPTWSVPAVPSGWPTLFPNFQTTTTSSNHLIGFQLNSSAQLVLRSLAPGPNAPSFVPTPPARSVAGDSANHNSAPSYECTSDAQCPATQSCLLGKCAGTCRQASQCPAGQGCNLGTCGNCMSQAACRSGEVCWVGQCYACTGANCCNTSADCAANNFCEAGTCRPQPAHGSGGFTVPNFVTRGHLNAGFTTVAPDGTIYMADTNTSNQAFFRIVSPGGVVATPSATVPFQANITFGPYPLAMVVSTGGGDTVFFQQGQNIYSAPASSSIGGWTTSTYTGFGAGNHLMRFAQGTSNLIAPDRPTLFATATTGSSGSNFQLLAIDAATAAAGGASNPGLLWTGIIAYAGCALSGNVTDQLAIGSDGTVYVTCPDGSVQAWAPDGDPTTGPPPGRMGLLKWKSAPPPSWGSNLAARPAIGKTSSGDVLYLARANNPSSLAILNLATAGNGTLPLEVNVDGSAGILTDASGRAITMGASKEVAMVSPTGAVLFSDKSTWSPAGFSQVLTGAGHLIMGESTSATGPRLTAVTVSNPTQVSTLFSVAGAGGLQLDSNSSPVVLSTTQVSGGLLFFDYPPLTGQNRTVSGLPYAQCPGPMPNAWSSRFGDLQRRSSLKTQ